MLQEFWKQFCPHLCKEKNRSSCVWSLIAIQSSSVVSVLMKHLCSRPTSSAPLQRALPQKRNLPLNLPEDVVCLTLDF